MIEYPGKDTFSRESVRRLLWLTRRGGCHTSWQEAGPDVSEGLTFKRGERRIFLGKTSAASFQLPHDDTSRGTDAWFQRKSSGSARKEQRRREGQRKGEGICTISTASHLPYSSAPRGLDTEGILTDRHTVTGFSKGDVTSPGCARCARGASLLGNLLGNPSGTRQNTGTLPRQAAQPFVSGRRHVRSVKQLTTEQTERIHRKYGRIHFD